MKFLEAHDRILAIYEERARLGLEEKELLAMLQEQCDHGIVIETPQGAVWRDGGEAASAPVRLCLICSFEEKGWPFKKLLNVPVVRKDVPKLEFWGARKLQPLEDDPRNDPRYPSGRAPAKEKP